MSPLTQIPFLQSPPPPPPRSPADPADLYDANHWESAYRQMHDFPTLLIQLQDDLSRSRKREAFWMSLVAHIVLILVIVNSPKFAKYLPHRAVMLVHSSDDRHLTFLNASPDTQKVPRPQTDKLGDKNRVAMSRQPQLNRQELKKLLDASRAGRPGPVAPPAPQQRAAAPQPSAAQSAPPQQEQQPQPTPPPPQVAKLQKRTDANKPN